MADTAQPAVAGEYPPLHGGKLFFLTVAIATASFMEILDMTIVNVSVPSISGSLGRHDVGGHLGGELLHAGRRHHAAALRLDRAALRRSQNLYHLDFIVHGVLGGLRHGQQPSDAGRRAPGPRFRVRSHDVGRTGDFAAQLSDR